MKIEYKLKDKKAEKSTLFTAFTVDNIYVKLTPNRSVEVKHWSQSKQVVLSGHPNSTQLNQYLKSYKKDIETIIEGFRTKGLPFDSPRIKIELNKIYKPVQTAVSEGKVQDFTAYMDSYMAKKPESMHRMYRRVIKTVHLAFKVKRIFFTDVNLDWLKQYEAFLIKYQYTKKDRAGKEVTQPLALNYRSKLIKDVKAMIDMAIEEKYVEHFAHKKSVKLKTEEVDSVFTDLSELYKIYNLKQLSGLEEKVRDLYVLNCFLGFRYSDLTRIQPHFFRNQFIKGTSYLIYEGRQKKTDYKVEFVLHTLAEKILKKYNFCLPVIGDWDFNPTIKMIALKAGLTKLERIRHTRGTKVVEQDLPKYQLISSHSGRRSFCTNFYNEGVRIQAIMSVSGHLTEREFLKYVHKDATVPLELVAEQVSKIHLAA